MKRIAVVLCVLVLVLAFFVGRAHAQCAPPSNCVFTCPDANCQVFCFQGVGARSPDQNADGKVNLADLAIFATAYPPNPFSLCADLDNNGLVNLADFSRFAYHWRHLGAVTPACW